ncbi:MAG: hypothetical protein OXG51_13645, partial [Gammaproteobacteria bacterium]|nr:hypothetical protein [Gammaproteobacteria bacterium]
AAGSFACEQVRIESVSTRRPDGVETGLDDELSFSGETELRPGTTIPVGELLPGRPRTVRLTVSHPPEEGVLLMLTASAWNGVGGSTGVRIGASGRVPAMPPVPPNDSFAEAMHISAATGSHAVDLLRATPDPGSRPFGGSGHRSPERPRGSVWYRWTAPATGLTAFAVEVDEAYAHRLDVYGDDDFAALESLASGSGDVVFLAESGTSYRVRLSDVAAGHTATLRWRPGMRPAHDDFADAAVLEGESGEFTSSNGGATLEPSEWFGGTVATTWHRWLAPRDGWWSFEREGRSNVAVFEGDSWENLRLVSGFVPGESAARFPAGGGREYRIMVGGEDAFKPVGGYTLGWRPWEPPEDNDEIQFAEALDAAAAGEQWLSLESSRTVSPDEPSETGVKTAWWTWEAPEAGRYTYRIDAPDAQLALFTGPQANALSPVGQIGPRSEGQDMTINAEAGQRFWMSAGFAAAGRAAQATYTGAALHATLVWGPTPGNDAPALAAALSGASGSASGNTRYATTASGESFRGLGRSTLWWSYEADGSGWIKVKVEGGGGPWSLAVLRKGADGELEMVRSSRRKPGSSESAEVTFEALAGVGYAIVVGVHGDGEGGEFELIWSTVEAPAWLRYAGRLEPWGVDARGEMVELLGPTAMATSESALYLASELGLQVFLMNPETGSLALHQTLEVHLGDGPMVWDQRRNRLLLQGEWCGQWRVFEAGAGRSELVEGNGLESANGAGCGDGDELHVTADGMNLYRNAEGRIDVFAFGDDGRILHRQTVENLGARIALPQDGGFLYAAEYSGLATYRRNLETGELAFIGWSDVADVSLDAIAVDDGVLFATLDRLDGQGPRTAAFSLDDPETPRAAGESSRFLPEELGWIVENCAWLSVRRSTGAGDVICPSLAYAFRWDGETGEVAVADYVGGAAQSDRYDNPVPKLGDVAAAAVSADGRWVYLASDRNGILIFRRMGVVGAAELTEVPASP